MPIFVFVLTLASDLAVPICCSQLASGISVVSCYVYLSKGMSMYTCDIKGVCSGMLSLTLQLLLETAVCPCVVTLSLSLHALSQYIPHLVSLFLHYISPSLAFVFSGVISPTLVPSNYRNMECSKINGW